VVERRRGSEVSDQAQPVAQLQARLGFRRRCDLAKDKCIDTEVAGAHLGGKPESGLDSEQRQECVDERDRGRPLEAPGVRVLGDREETALDFVDTVAPDPD